MSHIRNLAASLALSLAFVACDSSDGSPTGEDPRITERQRLLDALFAPATPSETTLVASQWLSRIPVVEGARWEDSGMVDAHLPSAVTFLGFPKGWTVPDSSRDSGLSHPRDSVNVRILSHLVDGNRHQVALWTPPSRARLPLVVFSHGGDNGLDAFQWSGVLQATKGFRDSIAILGPSFRSEDIGFLSEPISGGSPSTWDRDVEDLRSAIRAAALLEPRIDTTKVCVVGYSRGGGVALLAAARDPLLTCVATIAAPTSFQGPWVRSLAESILAGEPVDLPGVDFLAENVLLPYRDGRISLDSARRELVRRSASTWAGRLPGKAVFHHGYADRDVPSDELVRLEAALRALGKTPSTSYWSNLDHYRVLPNALQEISPFVRDALLP